MEFFKSNPTLYFILMNVQYAVNTISVMQYAVRSMGFNAAIAICSITGQ